MNSESQASEARRYSVRRKALRWSLALALLALSIYAIAGDVVRTGAGEAYVVQRFQSFVTVFLGIFIEAVPFLLAGSLVSGFIDVFMNPSFIERYAPKSALPAALVGASMGLLFPVCECGVVPVTRRLYEKGLPTSIGISFLLAAPVINPIVIFSTHAAFGFGPVFWGRMIITFLVAFTIGLVFSRAKPEDVLLESVHAEYLDSCTTSEPTPKPPLQQQYRQALNSAGDDFLDMGRYLVVGSLLAAALQTLVPQTVLLAVGQTPVMSVLAMQLLAFVLSVCSTVDAFIALSFAGTFATGAIVAFLTFGPMVDIKSSMMYFGVFQRRAVVYIILLAWLLTFVAGVTWNLNAGF
jgi:uncharacterized membrane protein YraQ (UPF0718 family)